MGKAHAGNAGLNEMMQHLCSKDSSSNNSSKSSSNDVTISSKENGSTISGKKMKKNRNNDVTIAIAIQRFLESCTITCRAPFPLLFFIVVFCCAIIITMYHYPCFFLWHHITIINVVTYVPSSSVQPLPSL